MNLPEKSHPTPDKQRQNIIDKMRKLDASKKIIVDAQNATLENDITLDDQTVCVSQECIDECMKLMLKDLEKQGKVLLDKFNAL